MKTTKPNTMSLLFRTHLLNGKDIFTVSAFATFTFNVIGPRLLEDQDLWKLVKLNLEKDEIFDLGLPKSNGEYLVYGKAYATKPVQGIGIYVNIGNLSKTLVALGNRYWTSTGISKPEKFTQMTVSYINAYGGNGYPENPIGKGYSSNSEEKIYLPNIEDPNKPITRRSDQPFPAGFTAYPIDWPQRMQYMGQIDNNYLQESWPEFPKGTNPLIFNTAPNDQQIKGFFQGTEKFTIKNMHPANPTQNSELPRVRARIFIVQKDKQNKEIFKELQANPETLWLFPNQEVGTLLFRASTTVNDEEYSNISQLYATWESTSEKELPIEFYANQFFGNNEPATELIAENTIDDASPVENKIEESTAEEIVADPVAETPLPDLNNALKPLQDLQDKMAAQLKSMGSDPAAEINKILNPRPQSQTPLPDLNSALKKLNQINQDIIIKNNLTQKDLDKVLNLNNSNTDATLSAMLKKLKSQSNDISPELKTNLSALEELIQKLQEPKDAPKVEDVTLPNGETVILPPEINQEPTLSSKNLTREDIISQYAINKNLSGLNLNDLDLSNLDLQGADFSRSILNNVNFQNSNLENTAFNGSFIDNADFSNTLLNNAVINDSYVGRANFLNANLTNTKITTSDLNSSNFNRSILMGAQFTEVNLDQSNLENIAAQQSKLTRCIISNCNLSNANFTEATLTDSDLSLSTLDSSKFNNAIATGVKLAGATGKAVDFKNATLSYSRADETTSLQKANFKNTNLNFASWEGAQLAESDFSNAIFDESNFSNSNFTKAKLELASAKKTDFSKAVFEHADLNRINLFKGSLRRSNLLAADLRYSNLYGVDFYKSSMGQTDLTGANLEQTLLSAMGVSPKII